MSNFNQAPAMEMETPGVFERLETTFRNSRLGQLATIGIASFGLASAAEAYVAEPVGAEPTPITTTTDMPASPSAQECIQAGLAKMKIIHPPVMNHAGIRPATPQHLPSQVVEGTFQYPSLPEGCAPTYERSIGGKIQMRAPDAGREWVNLTTGWGYFGHSGNDLSLFGPVLWAPSHAWPASEFNECIDGKFQKVRYVERVTLHNGDSGQVRKKRYEIPVRSKGSCAAAKKSAEITKDWPLDN